MEKMTSKERAAAVLSHKEPDRLVVDFGSTGVTGIHCKVVEALRHYYGLDEHPVYIHEPFQMLGLIENDLADAMGLDFVGANGECNMFGIKYDEWREFKMHWGQTVMMPAKMPLTQTEDGRLYTYPKGDTSVAPSGMMPKTGYFFDAIERGPEEIDDDNLNLEDNLEEFTLLTDHDIEYWTSTVKAAASTGRAVVASFGGMALGDIALVPGIQLTNPKGIRRVAEWYMSTVAREDFIKQIFDRQTEIAIENLKTLNKAVGDMVDVAFICGTDFGTQTSQFCSDAAFRELYLPYYRRINDWIHANTAWKTFKHSCGAMYPLIEAVIDSGFDILNPVQISAAGMDPAKLKKDFGDRITFWGGGADTQGILANGTPAQVADQTKRLVDIFSVGGGYVFNTVHNIQANVPVENVVSMLETLKEIRNV